MTELRHSNPELAERLTEMRTSLKYANTQLQHLTDHVRILASHTTHLIKQIDDLNVQLELIRDQQREDRALAGVNFLLVFAMLLIIIILASN